MHKLWLSWLWLVESAKAGQLGLLVILAKTGQPGLSVRWAKTGRCGLPLRQYGANCSLAKTSQHSSMLLTFLLWMSAFILLIMLSLTWYIATVSRNHIVMNSIMAAAMLDPRQLTLLQDWQDEHFLLAKSCELNLFSNPYHYSVSPIYCGWWGPWKGTAI